MSAPTVLVTGASGMLGGAVASALRDRGATVRAFQRRPADIDGVQDVTGSLTDAGDVRRAVKGADAVIHLAAKVSISGPEHEYRAINIEGTRHVVDALRAQGGGALVNVSSPSVAHLGRAIVGADATAADPSTARGPYSRTKAAAELLAMAADGVDGLQVTSIRPHVVSASVTPSWWVASVDRARRGRLPLLDHGMALIDIHLRHQRRRRDRRRLRPHRGRARGKLRGLQRRAPHGPRRVRRLVRGRRASRPRACGSPAPLPASPVA